MNHRMYMFAVFYGGINISQAETKILISNTDWSIMDQTKPIIVTTIKKSGNSRYARLPPQILKGTELKEDDYALIGIEDGTIIIKPIPTGEEKNKIALAGATKKGSVVDERENKYI